MTPVGRYAVGERLGEINGARHGLQRCSHQCEANIILATSTLGDHDQVVAHTRAMQGRRGPSSTCQASQITT